MALERSEDLLDPITLLAGCGGDALLLRTLIDSFRLRAPEHLDDLRKAAQRSDSAGFRRAAHKLRGFMLTFSASIAARIEVLEHRSFVEQRDTVREECATVAELVGALANTLSGLSIHDVEVLAARRITADPVI